MPDTFSTLIIQAQDAPLAREIAAAFGPGGAHMWTTPLSATGNDPATHYVSTGLIPEEFAYMMPTQIWETDEQGQWVMTESVPGNPQAVWGAASQAGVKCTLEQVQAIFDTADVTPQEPFVAMGRLGLKIINPPEV